MLQSFFFFINNNNNNIKSQTNSKHTFSHSENFYNLPERWMTLSKVLKKLPNYIKHNYVIQIQVQWRAVNAWHLSSKRLLPTSLSSLKVSAQDLILHKWHAVKSAVLSGPPFQVFNLLACFMRDLPFFASLCGGVTVALLLVITELVILKAHYQPSGTFSIIWG